MSDRWMTFDCYGTLLDWQTAFRRVFEPVAGDRTDALVTAFHEVEPEVERELLEELQRQGWKLGILTNCDDDLFEATRPALGVEIDRVVTAEQVRSYKPALGHFERFEAVTGVERRRWVHAAVSWWHDMEPARELGLRRVWVDREDSGHDASTVTARVTDMASLARLAADLEPVA